jgi:hypothetical protein
MNNGLESDCNDITIPIDNTHINDLDANQALVFEQANIHVTGSTLLIIKTTMTSHQPSAISHQPSQHSRTLSGTFEFRLG